MSSYEAEFVANAPHTSTGGGVCQIPAPCSVKRPMDSAMDTGFDALGLEHLGGSICAEPVPVGWTSVMVARIRTLEPTSGWGSGLCRSRS